MSGWLHLRQDIVVEFYEQALLGRPQQFKFEAAMAAYEEYKRGLDRLTKSYLRDKFARLQSRRAARAKCLRDAAAKCLVCKRPLAPNWRGRLRSKYCSKRCGQTVAHRAQTERARSRRLAKETERSCVVCGASMSGRKWNAVTCVGECTRLRHRSHQRALHAARKCRPTVPAVYPLTASEPDNASHADPQNTMDHDESEVS